MKEVIAALLVALGLSTGSAGTEVNTGYIFLGDSRTVGMDSAVDIEDDSMFVVAKVGQGYSWMVDTGLPEVINIIEDNPEYTDWVIVMNLGVNDLGNVDKYASAYEQLADLMTVYVVSVNPCKGYYDNLNDKIDSFNEAMQELECVTYIDTCSRLRDNGFDTKDGLHYSKSTYEQIYDWVCDVIVD